jgi:hypothetical protein
MSAIINLCEVYARVAVQSCGLMESKLLLAQADGIIYCDNIARIEI